VCVCVLCDMIDPVLMAARVSSLLRRRHCHDLGPDNVCLLLASVSQSSFSPVTD